MNFWALWLLISLVLLLAAVGVHALFFNGPDDYEWRKNIAARRRWAQMLEEEMKERNDANA